MRKYIVTYDLKKSWNNDREKDYQRLYEKLKSYTKAVRVTESSWVIQSYYSAITIKNELTKELNYNDAIFICALADDYDFENSIDPDYSVKLTMKG